MGNKECRIYAACGVSQTPISIKNNGGEALKNRVANFIDLILNHIFISCSASWIGERKTLSKVQLQRNFSFL